jgi:hypothetical protein
MLGSSLAAAQLAEKDVFKAAKSKSMFLNSISEPKLINLKFLFLVIHKMQQYISLLYVYQF